MSSKLCCLIICITVIGCGDESPSDSDVGIASSRDMSRRPLAFDMLTALSTDSGLAIIDGTLPTTDGAVVTGDAGTPFMADSALDPMDSAVIDAEIDAAIQSLPPIQLGADGRNFIGLPFHGLYDYSQLGMIYLADELAAAGAVAGMINSIQMEFDGWDDGYSVDNQTLTISHVVESNFPNVASPDYGFLTLSNTTTVKENFTYTNPPDEGWEQFVFERPFVWDGRSNILISWENRDGTYALNGYGSVRGDSAFANRSHQWRADSEYPDADSAHDYGRPNLKINSPGVPGHIH